MERPRELTLIVREVALHLAEVCEVRRGEWGQGDGCRSDVRLTGCTL